MMQAGLALWEAPEVAVLVWGSVLLGVTLPPLHSLWGSPLGCGWVVCRVAGCPRGWGLGAVCRMRPRWRRRRRVARRCRLVKWMRYAARSPSGRAGGAMVVDLGGVPSPLVT